MENESNGGHLNSRFSGHTSVGMSPHGIWERPPPESPKLLKPFCLGGGYYDSKLKAASITRYLNVRKRLLPRQLVQLAAADLLLACGYFLLDVLEFNPGHMADLCTNSVKHL